MQPQGMYFAAIQENKLVEDELQRVLSSHTFRRASRMRKLLEFVVKGTLDGTVMTERETARSMFGRGKDFDTGIDSEVRVQFGRLRRKLVEYYASEGKGSQIKIELPSRKYKPVFLATESGRSDAPPPVTSTDAGTPDPEVHSIGVLPFSNMTNDPAHDEFCYGLTEEIITILATNHAVHVIASNSSFQFKDQSVDVRIAGAQLGVARILEGSVRMEDDQTRVTARLARVDDGIVIWSNSFNATIEGALSTQQLIASEVVESLPLQQNR